jgi:hypothetical protein
MREVHRRTNRAPEEVKRFSEAGVEEVTWWYRENPRDVVPKYQYSFLSGPYDTDCKTSTNRELTLHPALLRWPRTGSLDAGLFAYRGTMCVLNGVDAGEIRTGGDPPATGEEIPHSFLARNDSFGVERWPCGRVRPLSRFFSRRRDYSLPRSD